MPGLGSSTDPPTMLALTLAVRPQRRGPGREADADPGRRRDGPPACDAQGSRVGEPGAGGAWGVYPGDGAWVLGSSGAGWGDSQSATVHVMSLSRTDAYVVLRRVCFTHVRRCTESDTLKL